MKKPSQLSVYLSGACDMKCAYCYVPRSGAALDREKLFRALESFVRAGGEKVTFLGGEPLLRWGLLKAAVSRLSRAHPGVRVTVFTNGARLDAARAGTLLGLGARIVLSLDGARADNDRFRKLRSGGSAFSAALRGLPRPLRARMTVSAVVRPETAARLSANIAELYSAGFRSIAWAPDIAAEWGPAEGRVLAAELLKVARDYARLLRSGRRAYEIANVYELIRSLRGGQAAGCDSLTLSPEGVALPCDKLLSAPAGVRSRFTGPAGGRRFFAEAAAAGADPAEPLCPAGYYSLLSHARGLSPAEARAALDLRLSFARIYGAAMRRLMKTLSALPAFRALHGLGEPL